MMNSALLTVTTFAENLSVLMSKWGVFRQTEPPHSAPCDDEGYLLPPHELSEDCPCKPDLHEGWIWAHNDPARGLDA